MNKYKCKSCSFIYVPEDSENIKFEELPDDWKCPVCGASKGEFEIIHQLGETYTGGEAQEKHVPVIEADGANVRVTVGGVLHPMEGAHYITGVELYNESLGLLKKIELKPGDDPVAVFEEIGFSKNLKALSYCNLHGLWESK